MKKFVALTLLFFIFYEYGFNQNDKTQNYKDDFTRIEISYGQFYSIKIFEDGLLCKTTDENLNEFFEFFPLKDLDFETFLKLQNYINKNNIFEIDSVVQNPHVIISSYQIGVLFIQNTNIKYVKWLSGENNKLKTIFCIANNLIPKKRRRIYSIYPSWLPPC